MLFINKTSIGNSIAALIEPSETILVSAINTSPKMLMKKICIIGSGSWGVALAIHLASIGNKVKIWSYEEEEKRLINEEKRCMFLPNVTIPENIECSNDFKKVIEDAEFILHVTPSKFTRSTFKQYKQYVDNKPIIICGKGFEKETLKTLDEVIKEELPTARRK